jgi:hypothetical protein
MKVDIFTHLARYRPTVKKESIENFLTELIAHLLREEPAIREAFVRKLSPHCPTLPSAHRIRTQVTTRSRRTELTGLFLDLVIEAEGSEIIVENKVDSVLTERQLINYLAYADEKNAHLAVIVKSSDHLARACDHPRFLGQYFWSDFADTWSRTEGVSNEYLRSGVLDFMRSLNMGAAESFSEDELAAHGRWLSLNSKMRRIVSDWNDKNADRDAFKTLSDLKYRAVFEAGGHLGVGWCAPAGKTPGYCSFWYFLGFIYKRELWSLPAADIEVPECVVFIGVWPSNVNEFADIGKELCPILISKDFQMLRSGDGKGIHLARRRTLRSFMNSQDQRLEIAKFLGNAHKEVAESGELGKLYRAYLATPYANITSREGTQD